MKELCYCEDSRASEEPDVSVFKYTLRTVCVTRNNLNFSVCKQTGTIKTVTQKQGSAESVRLSNKH